MTKLQVPQSADEIERFKALARVKKTVAAATAQARAAGDPLNITKHSRTPHRRHKLAGDPVEFIGNISRTKPAIARLTGKNKLNAQQVQAADTYRSAFETILSPLGGAMNFDRPRNGGAATGRSPPEAALNASQLLKRARDRIGVRATIIVEQIVCEGRTVDECTRLIYGYAEGQAMVHRDAKYVGRVLRESLTDLGDLWHPTSRSRGMRSCRDDELVVGDEGTRTISTSSYVAG